MSEITAFPLCWPAGRPRTAPAARKHARFDTSFSKARNNLLHQLNLLGAKGAVFSSDIPRRQDGLPYSNALPKSGDPGIACYFTRNGKQLCFACDCYLTVDDNMRAIALTVAALRGIARWGTGDMMEAAFSGFAALPERTEASAWWRILDVPVNATKEQIRDAYCAKAKVLHPDQGGTDREMAELNRAYAEALK